MFSLITLKAAKPRKPACPAKLSWKSTKRLTKSSRKKAFPFLRRSAIKFLLIWCAKLSNAHVFGTAKSEAKVPRSFCNTERPLSPEHHVAPNGIRWPRFLPRLQQALTRTSATLVICLSRNHIDVPWSNMKWHEMTLGVEVSHCWWPFRKMCSTKRHRGALPRFMACLGHVYQLRQATARMLYTEAVVFYRKGGMKQAVVNWSIGGVSYYANFRSLQLQIQWCILMAGSNTIPLSSKVERNLQRLYDAEDAVCFLHQVRIWGDTPVCPHKKGLQHSLKLCITAKDWKIWKVSDSKYHYASDDYLLDPKSDQLLQPQGKDKPTKPWPFMTTWWQRLKCTQMSQEFSRLVQCSMKKNFQLQESRLHFAIEWKASITSITSITIRSKADIIWWHLFEIGILMDTVIMTPTEARMRTCPKSCCRSFWGEQREKGGSLGGSRCAQGAFFHQGQQCRGWCRTRRCFFEWTDVKAAAISFHFVEIIPGKSSLGMISSSLPLCEQGEVELVRLLQMFVQVRCNHADDG